jgi:hypothetical protein
MVISTEPLTSLQRVELYFAALQRILVELPGIEAETIAILSDVANDEFEPAQSVSFVPEGADGRADGEMGARTVSGSHRVGRLAELLAEAFEEVRA